MLVQRSKAMVETRIYVQPCDGRLPLYQRSRVASSRKSWASTRHWHAARPRSIVPLWCSQARVDHTSPGAATLWSYTSLLGNHAMVPRALFNTPILGSIPHPSGKPAKASAPPLRSHAMACRASRPSHRFLDSHAMAGRASLVQPCQGLLTSSVLPRHGQTAPLQCSPVTVDTLSTEEAVRPNHETLGPQLCSQTTFDRTPVVQPTMGDHTSPGQPRPESHPFGATTLWPFMSFALLPYLGRSQPPPEKPAMVKRASATQPCYGLLSPSRATLNEPETPHSTIWVNGPPPWLGAGSPNIPAVTRCGTFPPHVPPPHHCPGQGTAALDSAEIASPPLVNSPR